MSKSLRAVLFVLCMVLAVRPAAAYSLLTHEQLIDLTWNSSIVPLLLSRYPNLTPAEIEHARAYAYGGCVIQDIGYYPFGDVFYSDLTHYVRSGDFVVNLFRDAQNADQLAFAVGALSHYIGDSIGHSEATNLSVPVEFPKLRDKYGQVVTYADGEHQHVQTEFAFDINEIAKHRLAPVHYLRHVGLQVPLAQLELAFYQTYGLHENFTGTRHSRINVGAYRFAVHRMIPRIAYALTQLHRHREPPDPTPADASYGDLKKLEAEVAAVEQENHWDAYRRHAGIGTYALAGFIFILPKIGPLKLLAIKGPTVQTEARYVHSVLVSSSDLDTALRRFTPPAQTSPATTVAAPSTSSPSTPPEVVLPSPELPLPQPITDPLHPLRNLDLDTGFPARPAGYPLTDATYATLAHRLASTPTVPIPPGIRADILAYYSNPNLPFATRHDPAAWAALQADLATLRSMPTTAAPMPYPTY
jgi:hypothetical protein